MIKSVWIALLVILLAGCAVDRNPAATASSVLDKNKDETGLPNIDSCLNGLDLSDVRSAYRLVDVGMKRIDAFLACYIGPMGADPEKLDRKVTLLRAHIITAVISRYAAFNVTGEVGDLINLDFRRVSDMPDTARSLISDFREIESGLRIESNLFKEKDATVSKQPMDDLVSVSKTYRELDRLLRVVSIADIIYESNKPTRQRTRQGIMNLINVSTAPTPGNVREALKDAKTALSKLAILSQFAHAYRIDVNNYLGCVVARENDPGHKIPTDGMCKATIADDWKYWDTFIDEACTRLDKIGSQSGHTCLRFTDYK